MKIFIFFTILLNSLVLKIAGQTITASNGGTYYSASHWDGSDPCTPLIYLVDYTPPSGYSIDKYEWYAGDNTSTILVRTETNPAEHHANFPCIRSGTFIVYCKIYIHSGTTNTTAQSSNYSFFVKEVNVSISPDPVTASYNCTQNISVTASNFSGSLGYNPGTSFSISSWGLPSGWSVASTTNNGKNATLTPDASTSGNITASVHLACGAGYENVKTVAISRPVIAPVFSSGNPSIVCSASTQSFSVTGSCSPSTYTYTLSNSGAVFTSNGLTTLTTSSSTVNVDFPAGSPYVTTLSAQANYPNNVSSAVVNSQIQFGTNSINYTEKEAVCEGRRAYFYGMVQPVPFATNYEWYSRDESTSGNPFILQQSMNANGADFPLPGDDRYYTIRVIATNPCGNIISIDADGYIYAPLCHGGGGGHERAIVISPNPSKNNITIQFKKTTTTNLSKTEINDIAKVTISNRFGLTLISRTFGKGTQLAALDISRLVPDIYIIKVWDGEQWTSSKFIKE